MKIPTIIGPRPQFIKAGTISREIAWGIEEEKLFKVYEQLNRYIDNKKGENNA
jgi:hypothetical protein